MASMPHSFFPSRQSQVKGPKTEPSEQVEMLPKTEQVEMPKEAWVCLVSPEKLFAIQLSNLKKQEVDVQDWTCLPPPNFDFVLELPKLDLCPFEFDSKIYMGSSVLPPEYIWGRIPVSVADLPPRPIYEFRFQENKIVHAESLDAAPLPFQESFIANMPGSGDVYFYIDMKSRVKDSSGFYVLRSGSRVLKQLRPPIIGNQFIDYGMFVLHNNLFFLSSTGGKESCLSLFDPINESWMVEPYADNNLLKFINDRIDFGFLTRYPQISVPLLGLGSSNNYTVCLSHEYVIPPLERPLGRVLAILINYQNGSVALYQYLDVCYEGIQPTVVLHGERFNLLDLGNGNLCAILSGQTDELHSGVLCFSVFTLSLLKEFAALQLDSGAPPMEQNFLEVTYHSKSIWKFGDMRHAFVWPPIKGGRFHHSTTEI